MFSYCIGFLAFLALCNAQAQPQPTQPAQPAAVQAAPATRSAICSKRNGYYKQEGSCDAFVECRDYRATNMMCPDGLHFNVNAQWPEYPCGYPMDVPCLQRGGEQPAKPTANCPHQFGFYPSDKASPDSCGSYKMCVAGLAIEMSCPVGLAFNPTTGRCDWPDLVPDCNVDAFLGFKCPAPPVGEDGLPIDIVQNFKYEGECYYFFSCEKGRARLLSCDFGFAFDPASGRCVDADLVQCPNAQRT